MASDPVLTVTFGAEHVLFVDDERQIAKLGAEMLTRMGYRVTSCHKSSNALSRFGQAPETFDVIVTDHTMPGLTGIDLAREVRKISPTVPIVLVTGFHPGGIESAAGDVVFSRILMKPYTGAELGQAIREALEQPSRPPADTPPS